MSWISVSLTWYRLVRTETQNIVNIQFDSFLLDSYNFDKHILEYLFIVYLVESNIIILLYLVMVLFEVFFLACCCTCSRVIQFRFRVPIFPILLLYIFLYTNSFKHLNCENVTEKQTTCFCNGKQQKTWRGDIYPGIKLSIPSML